MLRSTAVSRVLERLKDDGGLQGKDIANIVAVSPATVSRWSTGKATPDLRTQTVIAELRYVVDRLSDFYTPDETRLWLHAAHPMLDNERARLPQRYDARSLMFAINRGADPIDMWWAVKGSVATSASGG